MKQFICKEGTSNFYLVSEGMGGFLNPPEHAEHNFSIREERGGHEVGSYALSSDASWLPAAVKHTAARTLKAHPGKVTEEWVNSVYAYFRHCYSKDGINRNASDCVTYGKFWDNAEAEKNEDPTHHLGYLFVKQFDQNHTPRTDLF